MYVKTYEHNNFFINFANKKEQSMINSVAIDPKIYKGVENYAVTHNLSTRDVVEQCLTVWLSKIVVSDSPLRAKLKERIEHIRSLEENWDHQNAPRISSDICDLALKVISLCSDTQLKGLAIFPNTSDGIFMQWRTQKGRACLAIAHNFVAYDVVAGEVKKTGKMPKSEVEVFSNDLNLIM